ncbi:MAG: FKBP-type peptidyl-prolyl cis-trans isomerase [Muribaculaceae bacterium]|nr:FKBP-type peptidyl-prolyl cis-trans isomerase [Muribaculaceae bacterium]
MEKVQPGKYVEMVYDLYEVAPDGSEKLVHQSDPADPEKIVFGVTRGMIQPLEKAIDGLEAGGEFDVKVKADEAFGPYDPEQIAELDKDLFIVDGKFDSDIIKKGAVVPMMTADGFRVNGVVLDVTADKVKMDFNHPLAGKDVRFHGKVQTVRDATAEELQPAGGCGCGCGDCGDSCGCDGEKSCGDSGCGCH